MPIVLGDSSALNLTLGPGDLPHVRAVINGAVLASGGTWTLTGSTAEGFTWPVRGGSGTGSGAQVVLVDTLAPVNAELTYIVRVDGTVVAAATITRAFTGPGEALADLTSRRVARCDWKASGGDERYSGRRFHASTVAGSEHTPLRLAPVAGAGGGSMVATTVGQHTATLRELLRDNTILVRFHNPLPCQIPGCDIDPVTILYVVGDRSDRVQRIDVAEREWLLTYILQEDPESGFVQPLQTRADFRDAGFTRGAFALLGLTRGEASRTVWSEVG